MRLQTRAINLTILAITAAMIVIPYFLTPSARGFGTHEQLIPIPCLFYLVFQIPCPSCGLTTSLSFLLHGNLMDAIHANPLGPIIMILFIIILIESADGCIRGRKWWGCVEKGWFGYAIWCGISLYIGLWIVRMITQM